MNIAKLKLLLFTIIIWLAWATFSTGSLYDLKQLDQDKAQTRSLKFILSNLYFENGSSNWQRFHVEACSWHMPNWAKTEFCVRNRIYCESSSPTIIGSRFNSIYADIFSTKFKKCLKDNGTTIGLLEWLHASRDLFRAGVFWVLLWLTGGAELKGPEAESYEVKNEFWLKPLFHWAQKGA